MLENFINLHNKSIFAAMPGPTYASPKHCTTNDNFLTRLPPEIFQRVMSYSDPETMYDTVIAVPCLASRFVAYCIDAYQTTPHIPGATVLNHLGEKPEINRIKEEEVIDLTFATRIIRCNQGVILGRLQKDPSSLDFITKDTVVIFTDCDELDLWAETLRLLKKRGTRVWTYAEYITCTFDEEKYTMKVIETKYNYDYNEYPYFQEFRHINELKMINFTSLNRLDLLFSNSNKRPVIQGINAPLLSRLQITYSNHFPIIKNNTFGWPVRYDKLRPIPRDPGMLFEGVILIFRDALERSSGNLTRACPTTREEMMRDVDFGFDRYLHKAVVIGGPDAIMERLDLSNKILVSWRRASTQLPDNKEPVMFNTPLISMFIFETLFPEPCVPVLIGASVLVHIRITTYHPGLKLNGLFRRKSLESAWMYCYEAYNYDTGDFDNDSNFLIDEIDLWKAGTPREVHLYGCRANMDPETFDKKYINHEPPPDPCADFDEVAYLKKMMGYVEPEPELFLRAM